jgi:hypothetical protein
MSDQALVVIPSFDPVLSLVTDSVHSQHTRRAYRAALTGFLLWCQTSGPRVPYHQPRSPDWLEWTAEGGLPFGIAMATCLSGVRVRRLIWFWYRGDSRSSCTPPCIIRFPVPLWLPWL